MKVEKATVGPGPATYKLVDGEIGGADGAPSALITSRPPEKGGDSAAPGPYKVDITNRGVTVGAAGGKAVSIGGMFPHKKPDADNPGPGG